MKLLQNLFILLFICISFVCYGQQISSENYKSAVSFMYANYNNKTAFNIHTKTNWFEDGSGLWFTNNNTQGKEYLKVSFKNNNVTPLFNHKKLATLLQKQNDQKVTPYKINLSSLKKLDKNKLQFKFNKKLYTYNTKNNVLKLIELESKKTENYFESTSPDKKWIAYTKDYNLYIKSTKTSKEYQLTFDGKKNYEYATWYGWYDLMEGENGERPKHFWVNWSPDSKYLMANLCDLTKANKMYLLDNSIDTLYRPKLLSYYRGSPGDKNMVYMQPKFFSLDTKKEIPTKLPKNTHINSVSIEWTEVSGIAIANYSERGYQKEFVKKVNLITKQEQTVIKEGSTTNIDGFNYRLIKDLGKIVFLSERSGWKQLYLTDLETNETKSITNGNYVVNKISFIDSKRKLIYFLASGKNKNMNPYHQQLYKADFSGNVTLLTPENAHHIISFSEGGEYFVDNYSTVSIPTQTVLRVSKNGAIKAKLTKANTEYFTKKGWKHPEVFSLKAKDNKTTIYGAMWKPTHFDPNKKYPIIDRTYTGPHTQMFPKSYGSIFMNQSLAELGFIVVVVDGLGTSSRSKAFHNHSYKNMGNNLEDHVKAIKYLSNKYSWIDGDKVGIFGHSAGGFDTGRAMLAFPETFKVGVSSAADHDFRMEKAWWPEMYMGWPVDESYHKTSNITNAKNLQGKLLLIHGGMDNNVNPSATFKLSEALIKADKDFDLLILPSQNHGYKGLHRNYVIKKRWNYFVEHLLGQKPIWNFNWN
ncbi:S9 family peptidase [Tenacibaculum sp. 190524A02b]|uniref:S9 family peptidase n=1 Tax=Tenacibaculum vairaonense TaxID=3137860 RepID=UPI0032B16E3F